MTLDPQLLEILVCPNDHGDLKEEEQDDRHELVCQSCGLHYPVRDGIPIMLIEEAYRP
ncbi:MAG: Trm112 family protein [Acidimicrobiia bacterium]